MYNNIQITNLKERKVIYKNAKKIRIRNLAIMLVMFIFPLSMMVGLTLSNLSFKDTIAVINNPIYPPYSETGNIVFTNGQSYFIANKDNSVFVVPVKSYQSTIEDNKINFEIYSNPIVNACEDGIVIESSTDENNIKYIKIACANGITIKYTNLDGVGVKVGDAVLKNKEIATAKLNTILSLEIFYENNPVSNLKIENNTISWKN